MSSTISRYGELEFLQALLKRSFVNIPRMLFEYTADLGLDYDVIGKIFAVLACVGGHGENTFGPFIVSRGTIPKDYDQVRNLLLELEQKDIVLLIKREESEITFSFIPLLSRLRAIWAQYRERYEEDVSIAGVADEGLLAAQKMMGRPLSDREVADIQDWIANYGFATDMVQAVIREGQNQGITRMSYLNQIARQWHEENVRTPQEAEDYAQRYRRTAAKHRAIIQYIGLKRPLTRAEQALLDRWTEEWGFSNEVIVRACTEATGTQNPMQYINAILERWKEQGVRTVEDVEQVLLEHRRKPARTDSRGPARRRKVAVRSNVILQGEKKDDGYYDHIYKRFNK